MEDWGKSFENCCEWRVGDGKDILFWKDVWVCNEDLKSKFPRLFSLCGNKEGSLQSCGEWVNDRWEWKLIWRRGLFDREIYQEVQLLQEVHGKTPIMNSIDSRVWKAGKDSGFSVKSAYALLRGPVEGKKVSLSSSGRLLLTWRGVGFWWIPIYVVFAGWLWSRQNTCFLIAGLSG